MKTPDAVSQGAIADAYTEDGYYIARDLLSARECAELKTEALAVMQEHGKPGATVYVGASVQSPLFRRLSDDPRLVEILRTIMPRGVMFLSDKIVFKSGEKRFASPWHVDAFYWRDARPKLSVWIPLDDAHEDNGTLVVVRGSHHRDWVRKLGDMGSTNGEFDNVVADGEWAGEDEIICDVSRGSAIFFSDRLVHGSCPNTSGRDRYTIIGTYHDPAPDEPFDMRFAARHIVPETN